MPCHSIFSTLGLSPYDGFNFTKRITDLLLVNIKRLTYNLVGNINEYCLG